MTDTAVAAVAAAPIAPTAAVLAADEGERARFFADQITVKERRAEHDVWIAEIHAGCEPPLHVHQREDELLFVLEGRITAFADGRELELTAGATALLPRGQAHTYAVESGRARMLVVNTPGGFAGMFAAIERAFGSDMPATPRPQDGGTMAPVFAQFGLEMVGPNPRYA